MDAHVDLIKKTHDGCSVSNDEGLMPLILFPNSVRSSCLYMHLQRHRKCLLPGVAFLFVHLPLLENRGQCRVRTYIPGYFRLRLPSLSMNLSYSFAISHTLPSKAHIAPRNLFINPSPILWAMQPNYSSTGIVYDMSWAILLSPSPIDQVLFGFSARRFLRLWTVL